MIDKWSKMRHPQARRRDSTSHGQTMPSGAQNDADSAFVEALAKEMLGQNLVMDNDVEREKVKASSAQSEADKAFLEALAKNVLGQEDVMDKHVSTPSTARSEADSAFIEALVKEMLGQEDVIDKHVVSNESMPSCADHDSSGRRSQRLVEQQTNQSLSSIELPSLDVLDITAVPDKGLGVVARSCIAKGTVLCEYPGELFSAEEGRIREMEYGDADDNYVFFFTTYNNGQTRQWCLDATKPSCFKNRRDHGIGRFINHSNPGNCKAEVTIRNDLPCLKFVASTTINENEELTYCYGDRRTEAKKNFPFLKTHRLDHNVLTLIKTKVSRMRRPLESGRTTADDRIKLKKIIAFQKWVSRYVTENEANYFNKLQYEDNNWAKHKVWRPLCRVTHADRNAKDIGENWIKHIFQPYILKHGSANSMLKDSDEFNHSN